MKEDNDEFLHRYPSNLREIIDNITGIIFQTFPNIKEKVVGDKLKYIDVSKGSICSIYVREEIVILEFRNSKKFKFNNIDLINRKEVEKCLKNKKK